MTDTLFRRGMKQHQSLERSHSTSVCPSDTHIRNLKI